jgi:zinc transporter, ZIP family
MVIGLTIVSGGEVSAAYLAAVFLSNLPESIGSSTGLATAGWTRARIIGLWGGGALVSGISSALGYGLLEDASDGTVAFVQTFAAGAILTMLADTMLPEAYKHGAS